MCMKTSTFNQWKYALKKIWEADKLLLIFTLFKNAVEQAFNVFFFVYLIKYLFNCIDNGIEYNKIFWFFGNGLFISCCSSFCLRMV